MSVNDLLWSFNLSANVNLSIFKCVLNYLAVCSASASVSPALAAGFVPPGRFLKLQIVAADVSFTELLNLLPLLHPSPPPESR